MRAGAVILVLWAGVLSMAGPGCYGNELGNGGAGGSGGTACPAGLPVSSSPCTPEGLNCHYSGCSGAASYCGANAFCSNGSWSIGYTDCACPSSGGTSSGGRGGAGGSAAGCSRVPADDAHCSTLGYPSYAYFCPVRAQRPDPTCAIYNGIGSGDFYCCP